MSEHPNFRTVQASWDALAAGNFAEAVEALTDDLVVDNGPGAGHRGSAVPTARKLSIPDRRRCPQVC